MFSKDKGSITYKIDEESVNEIIDERGNTVIALRKVQWGSGKEPKLELRKWFVDIDKETPNKGVVFLTEEGPSNLVKTLLKHGYGNTVEVLDILKEREDFKLSMWTTVPKDSINFNDKKDNDTIVEYYDPKESLLGDFN